MRCAGSSWNIIIIVSLLYLLASVTRKTRQLRDKITSGTGIGIYSRRLSDDIVNRAVPRAMPFTMTHTQCYAISWRWFQLFYNALAPRWLSLRLLRDTAISDDSSDIGRNPVLSWDLAQKFPIIGRLKGRKTVIRSVLIFAIINVIYFSREW